MRRTLGNRMWQALLKFAARLAAVAAFQFRCSGRDRVPAAGGGLVLSNHQSNLDPIVIGLACDRRLNYVARQSLFRFAPLRWLINSLDAIPIDRDGPGLGGLKETLRRLKRGEMVLLFPEGTRTPDGEVHPMKSGFCTIARRAGVPLIPVALDGSFEAWPRQRAFPRTAVIHVQYGTPIAPQEIAAWSDEQVVAEVEGRIRQCHALARSGRLRAQGRKLASAAASG